MNSPNRRAIVSIVIAMAALGACSDGSDRSSGAVEPEPKCAEIAPRALQMCLSQMNAAAGNCYFDGGSACAEGDPTVREALGSLQEDVEGACADGDFLGLSTDAVVGRLQNACQSQSDSIAWRTFGGPQGAVWPAVGNEGQSCLQLAHETVSGFFDEALVATNDCLDETTCDAVALKSHRESAANAATVKISEACAALEDLIAVDPATYVDRASDQLDCTVATAHENVDSLQLTCGPSNVETVPVRGEWTQIVLDGDKWGTLCGDGSEYAIYARLAPQGNPLDRVLVGLEGGSVCFFEGDCRNRLENSPHLFNARMKICLMRKMTVRSLAWALCRMAP